MHTLTPSIKKLLVELANKLPDVTVKSTEAHMIKGAEILSWNTITEIDGNPINPEQVYKWNFPVIRYADHYKRLKRRYVKKGIDGVQQYLDWIETLKKRQQINRTMQAIGTVIKTVNDNLS